MKITLANYFFLDTIFLKKIINFFKKKKEKRKDNLYLSNETLIIKNRMKIASARMHVVNHCNERIRTLVERHI